MGFKLSDLKGKIVSKVRMLTGELMLSQNEKQLLRELFCADERKQMDAAVAIGKSCDIRLLCMLQFYMHDDFLDEIMLHLRGRDFHYEFAQKKMVRFYSLVAASNMLSQEGFFETLVGTLQSRREPLEERCDIMYVVGSVFEQFGYDIHSREEAFTSEKIGGMYVTTLISIMGAKDEPEEAKVASAISLGKTVQNPAIRMALDATIAKEAFEAIAKYPEVAKTP